MNRRKTRKIFVGSVPVGGGSPISVQSMTKTDTRDVRATVRQIRRLEKSGCEIIRLAVPDAEAADALADIRKSVSIPVIADIHFDWRLALRSIQQGIDGLRINPGNIGARWKVHDVVSACRDKGLPIRIGVNAGSLDKKLLGKFGRPSAEALVESAGNHIEILESLAFRDIKVSLKASNVPTTVEAYRLFSRKFRYPLHVGISEAGPSSTGVIKSSVGLGILLYNGIGDTVRVSLTADPVEEVKTAYEILKSLGLRERGPSIISCPTCGRCEINLKGLAGSVEKTLRKIDRPLTVAVMGCIVNGPGEAREADIGIAGGRGRGILFKKGRIVKSVNESDLLGEFLRELENTVTDGE